jgi:hypothetical protein
MRAQKLTESVSDTKATMEEQTNQIEIQTKTKLSELRDGLSTAILTMEYLSETAEKSMKKKVHSIWSLDGVIVLSHRSLLSQFDQILIYTSP